jgi:hypothetical protein
MIGLPIIVFLCLVLNGLAKAGNWDDDPKNWERAFGAPVPKDVLVIHSTYLRTPHFTREEEFSFQFKAPPGYVTDWVTHEKMRESGPNDEKQIQELKARRPKWFLPKPPSSYQGWSFPDEPHSNFRLFVDRETGEVFYTDSQM